MSEATEKFVQDVHENGFRRTFESRFNGIKVNYEDPITMLLFAGLQATVINFEAIRFAKNLTLISHTDAAIEYILYDTEEGARSMAGILKSLKAVGALGDAFDPVSEDWANEKIINIFTTYDLTKSFSNLIQFLMKNDLDMVDGLDKFVADMNEFGNTIEKLYEMAEEGRIKL